MTQKKKGITVRFDSAIYKALTSLAEAQNRSLANLLETFILEKYQDQAFERDFKVRELDQVLMKPVAIRGATTVKKNNPEEIKQACVEMMQELINQNQIKADDIVMVFVTMTQDLTAYNAAAAIRLGMDWSDVAFFTSQEPQIDKSLARCIRVLVQVYSNKSKTEIKHVYLGEAAKLRPDLKSK